MNYLAHLLLSGTDENVIMGNFVGDYVKGKLLEEKYPLWPESYLKGLKLHRFIDQFTDAHPVVRQLRSEVAIKFGRISGIIIDVYFDYFLAKHFAIYSQESLADYSQQMYLLFDKRKDLVPSAMQNMVAHMVRQDWLMCYSSLEGIDLTFWRMSHRTDYLLPIRSAGLELRKMEERYDQYFMAFYPELSTVCDKFLQKSV